VALVYETESKTSREPTKAEAALIARYCQAFELKMYVSDEALPMMKMDTGGMPAKKESGTAKANAMASLRKLLADWNKKLFGLSTARSS
jgi:hypothetical protein